MEFFNARTVFEAYREMAGHMKLPRGSKKVSLIQALGCCVYHDLLSPEDIPGFGRSTMDGYAVRARDTFGALEGMPAYLEIMGEVPMGKTAEKPVKLGQAWRISTGGMLPEGSDAVVMVEHTEDLGPNTIGVNKAVAPGDNIVRRGEDSAAGELLIPQGQVLRPQELGVLAAAGITQVEVEEPLRVAIVSTGDEVVDPSQTPLSGQVRDINSYTLYGMVKEAGALPLNDGIVGDDPGQLKKTIENALKKADILLLSGGSSVGTRDIAAAIIKQLGCPGILFHGISIKPGKPTIGAVVEGKPVFGLPGHPVSAMVVFILMIEPLLRFRRYPLNEDEFLKNFPITAIFTRNVRSAAGREDFIRVSLRQEKGHLYADPVLGKSGLITTMSKADGLARISPGTEGIEAGQRVRVKLL